MKIGRYVKKPKEAITAQEKQQSVFLIASASLILNLTYALYNGALGIWFHSIWLMSMCAYYIILSAMRFSAVHFEYSKTRQSTDMTEEFITRICGAMLILLAIIISASVYLSFKFKVAVAHHEIVMITIATYTFYKTTLAIINVIKALKKDSMLLRTLRNISCADAAVSMISLQRSMLASFGDINSMNSHILNAVLGGFVCTYIFVLGIGMIITSKNERS